MSAPLNIVIPPLCMHRSIDWPPVLSSSLSLSGLSSQLKAYESESSCYEAGKIGIHEFL